MLTKSDKYLFVYKTLFQTISVIMEVPLWREESNFEGPDSILCYVVYLEYGVEVGYVGARELDERKDAEDPGYGEQDHHEEQPNRQGAAE